MRIALICTDYPPARTSAAVQMRDLAIELQRQGHAPVVILPCADLPGSYRVDVVDGVEVLRVGGPHTKDIGYVRRAFAEMLLPFAMLRGLGASPRRDTRWDLVVWYSPTIFLGPLAWRLKRRSGCRAYLILRDIFPEWAVDLGLMKKGLPYAFFKLIAGLQYAAADTIGVQTPSNVGYVRRWHDPPRRRVEVLQNWLAQAPQAGSSIQIAQTSLAGRRIYVYIGNMGVAQGMDIFIDLATRLQARRDLGFLFVGRGSEVARLAEQVSQRSLSNTLFFAEVDSREMPGLLAQCHVGLLALDPRHKTHNIPGKFLTYLLAGLPVLARVNAGTDLAELIEHEQVGHAYVGSDVEVLADFAIELADDAARYARLSDHGRSLGRRMFSPEAAAKQILALACEARTVDRRSGTEPADRDRGVRRRG